MAAYATVEDYEARAAVSLPEGTARRRQVEVYLDDATALIKRHIPAGFTPDAELLTALCVTVVRRVITNPGGRRQLTVGGFSETLGEDGGLYLTEREIDSLQPEDVTDPDADAAYSLNMTSGPAWIPDPAGVPGPFRGGWL